MKAVAYLMGFMPKTKDGEPRHVILVALDRVAPTPIRVGLENLHLFGAEFVEFCLADRDGECQRKPRPGEEFGLAPSDPAPTTTNHLKVN